MALFKMRKGGEESAATPRQPESVEAMRKRARHRLIGAGVLVLVGVVGFPLLFDTQPRPIAVDIPIEIPDRNKAKPLPAPKPISAAPAAAPASPPVAQAPAASGNDSPGARPEPKVASGKSEPKPEAKADSKPETKPDSSPTDGARAQALLEGKAASGAQATTDGRFIVQVGAFSDTAKMRETRSKVERAGMKTYTHVAETKEGKLTRVRVGPFASKAEADQAAQKLKALDLDPHVLKL